MGHWQLIQWQPDLFVQQLFSVGVIVESGSGERAFQLMERPGRIECFFLNRYGFVRRFHP